MTTNAEKVAHNDSNASPPALDSGRAARPGTKYKPGSGPKPDLSALWTAYQFEWQPDGHIENGAAPPAG